MSDNDPILQIRKRFDDALTNYLRNTTTDQELLDFYGEGNIIGRKGIPSTRKDLINQTVDTKRTQERPRVERAIPKGEDLLALPGRETRLVDLPRADNPATGRPYQLQFGTVPFPREGMPTAAAQRFLSDFRVPTGATVDYGFEVSPNVEDVKAAEAADIIRDPYNYKDQKAAFNALDAGQLPEGELRAAAIEQLREIEARASGIRRFSGRMATPSEWRSRGFELPENLKDSTLNTFQDLILQQEKPFGSVSQLTPVVESAENVRPGGAPDWRANLYEQKGFAGPLTEVSVRGPYGEVTDNIQMFTRGRDRLLPIQPYTEFLDEFDASKPSALGTKPAPDFTPFQKGVGTRNYLIGRNILQGRGSLGQGFRGAASIGAIDLIPSREAVRDFYKGDAKEGALRMAGDFVQGIPIAIGTGLATTVLPAGLTAVALPPAATTAGMFAGGEALDEAIRQQTGEGVFDKISHTVNKIGGPGFGRPTSEAAYRGSERVDVRQQRIMEEGQKALESFNQGTWRTDSKPVPTPEIRQITSDQMAASISPPGENEAQRRLRLAGQRLNPSRGEFGLTELLFGK